MKEKTKVHEFKMRVTVKDKTTLITELNEREPISNELLL